MDLNIPIRVTKLTIKPLAALPLVRGATIISSVGIYSRRAYHSMLYNHKRMQNNIWQKILLSLETITVYTSPINPTYQSNINIPIRDHKVSKYSNGAITNSRIINSFVVECSI